METIGRSSPETEEIPGTVHEAVGNWSARLVSESRKIAGR